MAKKKVNIWIFAVIILAILLLCSITYVCVTNCKQAKDDVLAGSFQNGVQYGYESAVNQIMESASNCQQAEVYFGNETMQLIDVSCLR